MKAIDMTVPLGIATPAWPTYEPLQVKYFKRLAPNGANGQLVTHSNHVGTHLDGEIHFFTPGKDIASLDFDYLLHDGVVVDISDAVEDYDIYTSEMLEERAEIHDGDILIIHTGYHAYGWDQPTADEVRYMTKHPGPDREFAEWARRRKLRWIGVDCGSADHPFNTAIRGWCPRQLKECEAHFQQKYGKSVEEIFDDSKYQLMHLELFNHHIVHAECIGGDIDLLLGKRCQIGCFPWRFVDGESSIARIVGFVDDDQYDALMKEKSRRPLTRFGDVAHFDITAYHKAVHAEVRAAKKAAKKPAAKKPAAKKPAAKKPAAKKPAAKKPAAKKAAAKKPAAKKPAAKSKRKR